MPFGENTIASEKGVNLSGGQRARISMARALYSDADIFLFDDSLSAVDAPVAKFLLSTCINGYLKSKIRILITHHAQHLRYADKILIMKEGKIEARGTYKEVASFNLESLNLMSKLDPQKQDELEDEEEDIKEAVSGKPAKELSNEMKQKQQVQEFLYFVIGFFQRFLFAIITIKAILIGTITITDFLYYGSLSGSLCFLFAN